MSAVTNETDAVVPVSEERQTLRRTESRESGEAGSTALKPPSSRLPKSLFVKAHPAFRCISSSRVWLRSARRIRRPASISLSPNLSEGAAVGEMSLLTGKPRSATVTTVQPTVVFTLTRADFRNLLTQHPEISLGLARILAERLEDATKQVGIEYVNLFKGNFDPRVVGLLPQSLCLLHKVVPISYVNNSVTLAMVNPSNLVAFDDVRRYIKGAVIEPQVCTEEDFRKFMETVYPQISWALRRRRGNADRRNHEERRREDRRKIEPCSFRCKVWKTCRTKFSVV